MKRVLVALSGGVDSSVAAYLLQQQGYECIGVTMKLYHNDGIACTKGHTCCSLDDIEDARSVAYRLGIPYHVFDFSDTFDEKVIQKFVSAYEQGRTPNPCIDCNRYLKFERLLQRAKELNCDFVATGHYAQRIWQPENQRYALKMGIDDSRDQSYALYAMTQDQLAHTLLPLGGLHKTEVRRIAEEQGFVNAKKHDSQDICFVPDGDYVGFLKRYTQKDYPVGDILDIHGNVIGTHQGAVRYTIGQRKGLGLAMGEPVYVCGTCPQTNTVTVGSEKDLYAVGLEAEDWNRVAVAPIEQPMQVQVRVRYHQKEQSATVYPVDENGRVKVLFDQPQRAVTPGQAVVIYQGDLLIGGGTIATYIK